MARSPGFKAAVSDYYRAPSSWVACCCEDLPSRSEKLPTCHALPDTAPSQLRLIHYPYDNNASDRPGLGAHTDYEFFTMLRSTAPVSK